MIGFAFLSIKIHLNYDDSKEKLWYLKMSDYFLLEKKSTQNKMNLTDFNRTNKKEKFVIIIMIKSTQIDNKIKKIKKSETLTQTTRKQTCQIYI